MSKDGRIWLSHTGLGTLERCLRCFWLQYNKKIRQPEGIVSRLANRFDTVLKNYFNIYRPDGGLPPLVDNHLEGELQNPFQETYFYQVNARYGFMGKLDECIINKSGELIPVDFKTSSSDPREKDILTLYPSYKTQIDDYVFLMEKNGKKTAGYGFLIFIYPGDGDNLHNGFPMIIHSVKIHADPDSVLNRIEKAVKVLGGKIPKPNNDCDFCSYRKAVKVFEK